MSQTGPSKQPSPTEDEAPQLVVKIEVDGNESIINSQFERPSCQSLHSEIDVTAQDRSGGQSTPDSASEESYDKWQGDPLTVFVRGQKGIYGHIQSSGAYDNRINPGHGTGQPTPTRDQQLSSELNSIPVTIGKADKNGEYHLIVDDSELREILKMGVERESNTLPSRKIKKFGDLVFTRQFTAFDRQNTASVQSPFHGFFTLFWLGTAIFVIQIAAKNWHAHGNILGTNEIMKMMLNGDLVILGLSDGVICAATGFGFVLQKLILNGYINWQREGWIIQSVWQIFYMLAVLSWTSFRKWPWTHTVFFVLHGLVMVMKQHSYAFYNGHLSELYKKRRSIEKKLRQLQGKVPVKGQPATTATMASSVTAPHPDQSPELRLRRLSKHSNFLDGRTGELAHVAAGIESGDPLDINEIRTFERAVQWEIDALSEELRGRSSQNSEYYPKTLGFWNHYEFIVLPTLVYELEYPRTDKIDWYYVVEKAVATLGILFIMMLVSQTFIYPVVMTTVTMKRAGMPLQVRLQNFPWVLSELVFPFMMEYMMAWYVIWECILNLLAEVTYFADRRFYSEWWNSVSWDQYARDWNRPVYNFLLRHVYHSSISSMRVNKYTATLITFFLSALVHELVMWTLFKKLRGYLLFLQMMQVPLVQLSRTKWLKDKAILGNLIFWIGLFTGPSLLCSLYLIL